MFSDPYRKAYYGMAFPGGDDSAFLVPARRDALNVLRDAADRCWEQDMRTEEVHAALDFLKTELGRDWIFDAFWKALLDPDVAGRRRRALAELRVIVRNVPMFVADSRKRDF